ncbi:hypothetical protein [Nocardioides sp. YIM 152588]|uniref:hypothetical protein n=1 Tax=Nocardioides sp. YIM 152588 TaxID=3158259 RepID=UPI0032E4CF2B
MVVEALIGRDADADLLDSLAGEMAAPHPIEAPLRTCDATFRSDSHRAEVRLFPRSP